MKTNRFLVLLFFSLLGVPKISSQSVSKEKIKASIDLIVNSREYVEFMQILKVRQSAQTRVGDPGVTFDQSLISANKSRWPQMKRWSEAGARKGITPINKIDIKATLNDGADSDDIIAAIKSVARKGGGGVFLKNGTYTIDKQVNMESNVFIIGESREKVRCVVYMDDGNGFLFYKGKNSGLYRLTVSGSWGTPKYLWMRNGVDLDQLKGNDNRLVRFNRFEDGWLDQVNLFNAGRDPVRIGAEHITFRDIYVDGCHRKAGGAQGYFFFQNSDNLITSSRIIHIRHISLQGDNVEYNVVYDNDFLQEVSFHSGDNGNNLIENNRIDLPKPLSPSYFAIMGPWSSKHHLSASDNFLYRNKCREFNHNVNNPPKHWSNDNVVYRGPIKVRPKDPSTNFPKMGSEFVPKGKTLYPIKLDDNDGNNNTVNGGRVTTSNGATSITTITGDGNADVVRFQNNSNASASYIYIITDDSGKILTTERTSHNFEGASVGTCRVYGLSYTGSLQLSGKSIRSSNLSSDKFSVSSNAIIVTRENKGISPSGNTIKIPGTFEAEALSSKSGSVRIENTPGNAGGNIGFIKNEDYVEYNVNVRSGGQYSLEIMASSKGLGGTIDILENGSKKGSVRVSVTGEWHSYRKFTTKIMLSSGDKKLRLLFKGGNGFLFNIDKINVTKDSDDEDVSQTIALSPIQDAYLQGSSRLNNDIIRIEQNQRIGYLMFDLSSVNGTITNAELKFTIASDAGNGKVNIHMGSNTNWTEQNLSNANKPLAKSVLGSINSIMKIGDTKTIPLRMNNVKNKKISLLVSAVSGNDFAFASKENESAKKPQLIITYDSSSKDNVFSKLSSLVYPNPFTDLLQLKLPSDHTFYQLGIININGQKVYNKEINKEESSLQIDLSHIQNGIYFVQLLGLKQKENLKIIKN
ncbi:carbohydrate-binding protein [Aquimarina aggregata]|uniref:carbohydrate-binding protein n=1 Tax=Aquimarina aggregata TaxID=1642818 RepID=UPI002491168D|nr:carbohydrate-binding protein [Aquimarina aggregata]